MSAINLNGRDYYVTGVTKWDDGRERHWDDFKHDPIVCPQTSRYGPEIEVSDPSNRKWGLPKGCIGYTVTVLTCEKLDANQHSIEHERAEDHCGRMLNESDN